MASKTKEEIASIKEMVNLLKQYVATPQLQEMKINNRTEYTTYLESVFPTFATSYPTLFNFIIKGNNDTDFLDKMLEGILKIAEGNDTKENIEKKLGEDLADTYLYPKIGHIHKKQRIDN